LREFGRQRQALGEELRQLADRRSGYEARLAARERQLGLLLAAAYRSGEFGYPRQYLHLLLSGNNPNQISRDLHYLALASRAEAQLIDSTRNDLAVLRDMEARARDKARQVALLETAQSREHAQLAREQAARRKVLERVSARIRLQRREVKTLERDEARLARVVEALSRALAEKERGGTGSDGLPDGEPGRPFAGLRGRLKLPVAGVVTNRFGSPRIEGGPNWKGVFIRTAAGEEVRAVAAGRVVFSDWMRGLGNLLVLDHGEGYLTIYGNNEAVYKNTGDEVKAGEVIAAAGATGGTDETGLYFEIRHEGRAFDPMSWLTPR
jgi:septal ring factor EnvC (AmiA/AmiB activator)